MRLKDFKPGSIRVRRGGGGRRLGGAGGIGCGGIVIVLVGVLLFGADPAQMIGMVEGGQQTSTQSQGPASSSESDLEICDDNQYSMETCNALASLNETWEPLFREANIQFEQPILQFLQTGATVNTACGRASSAMGPFYCPGDHTINIDVAFYNQMAQQMGAGGDFARYYVMAHEYGHHIQNLVGLADQVRSAQAQSPRDSNQLQVRMELQADCYAGVWASRNRNLIEPGDLEEGMRAANAIGDDTLIRNAGRSVNHENFTHGSSAQRMEWLRLGLRTGDEDQCDTFADLRG